MKNILQGLTFYERDIEQRNNILERRFLKNKNPCVVQIKGKTPSWCERLTFYDKC